MVIANPIYDTVFKRLMENRRVATFFIETLLDETIEDIELQPQEVTYAGHPVGVALMRFDFVAAVKTAAGGCHKVLIEIQKAHNTENLLRFRDYQARQDAANIVYGCRALALPVITIYFLDFCLPEIPAAAIKSGRQYTDLVTHEVLEGKSDFIEKLVQGSYIVQIPRTEGSQHTQLEKLLGIFEQKHFIDEQHTVKEYNHIIDNDAVRTMTDILYYAGIDLNRRQDMKAGIEAWRVTECFINAATSDLKKLITEKDKKIKEQEELIKKQVEAIQLYGNNIAGLAKDMEEIKSRMGVPVDE